MTYCETCGAQAAYAPRLERAVHLEAVPGGVDPDHDVVLVDAQPRGYLLRDAALDMLTHHASLHPETGCPFSYRLAEALRKS